MRHYKNIRNEWDFCTDLLPCLYSLLSARLVVFPSINVMLHNKHILYILDSFQLRLLMYLLQKIGEACWCANRNAMIGMQILRKINKIILRGVYGIVEAGITVGMEWLSQADFAIEEHYSLGRLHLSSNLPVTSLKI